MYSLKKNYQFSIVYKNGKSIANKSLVMYLLPNSRNHINYGISISKKLGKSVTRNRIRRLIKESLRLRSNNIKQGFDMVIIARSNAKELSFNEINKSIENLIKRHGIHIPTQILITINFILFTCVSINS